MQQADIYSSLSAILRRTKPFRTSPLLADTVIKTSIFVPYESGALTCFEIFDRVFTKLLFSSSMKIVSSHCYNSSYVRDCGALVLTADFTIRSTEKS